jgi:hypothetical protein
MSNFGDIRWEVWEAEVPYHAHYSSSGSDPLEFFLHFSKAKIPSATLIASYEAFIQQKKHVEEEIKKNIDILSQQPFFGGFLAWIKQSALDPSSQLLAKTLLESGFIRINDVEENMWTIANARLLDHRNIIEAIRCRREWSFELRENLVKTYLQFIQWLSKATNGFIPFLEDPDLQRTKDRSLNFVHFISFLSKLREEDQILAKLMYFGGGRTLEEVLALDIKEIDFNRKLITFDSHFVSYPLHVFADLQLLIDGRQSGRVFVGRRNNAPAVNPATIFRNFKEAAIEIGLGKSFTPKVLTTNY